MRARLARSLLLLFLALLAIAAASSLGPKARSVLSLGYVERLISYPRERPVTTTGWYHPLERVPGGGGRPLRKSRGLSQEALAKLAEHARTTDTAALLVTRGQEILFEYPEDSSKILTDSNSMAKTPLGLLYGIALSEGKISSIDDPAARYLPEWASDARSKITLRQLLAMTAGLRKQDSRTFPLSDIAVMHLGTRLSPFALSIPAAEEPGRRHEYNNVNSQILAEVLTRAYGQRYATLLSEKLWKWIATDDAFVWLDREGGAARTYCCLFARPADWARLGGLMLSGGRVGTRQVVPRQWILDMTKRTPLAENYGLHVWIGPDFHYMDGRSKQRVYMLPKSGAVVVRVGENVKGWEEGLLPGIVAEGLKR
jgi:hypothetical protein